MLLHSLPIFHIHGLFVATNTVLASAASMIFLPKFDTREVLSVLPRASVMMGVPTYYTRMLGDPRLSRESTRHMRLFVSGSAPLSAEHHREFEQRTGTRDPRTLWDDRDVDDHLQPLRAACPRLRGRTVPGVEVRITPRRLGAPEPDAIGMIEVRGPNVFQGYWRNPQKTAADFRTDGFFVTGDIGRIDAHGYVHIVGRAKDLIITGGYNVYPAEVEQELNALPGVLESAVFGVPHPDFGEGVTALIVRTAGAGTRTKATILRSLRERLAGYKLPKRVLFAAELPRNTMGKVQKQALRDAYAKLYCDASTLAIDPFRRGAAQPCAGQDLEYPDESRSLRLLSRRIRLPSGTSRMRSSGGAATASPSCIITRLRPARLASYSAESAWASNSRNSEPELAVAATPKLADTANSTASCFRSDARGDGYLRISSDRRRASAGPQAGNRKAELLAAEASEDVVRAQVRLAR